MGEVTCTICLKARKVGSAEMNIAPVNKDGCTFGKRTDIPGMAKFDELSKLKVWTETCNDEIAHWARGIREMPPDRTFRVDDPIKSESIAMAEPVPAPRLPPQYSTWAAVAE